MCPKFICHLRHLGRCRDLDNLRNVSASRVHIATYWYALRIAHLVTCTHNPFVNCGMLGCVEMGHFAENVQARFAKGRVENWRHFAKCFRNMSGKKRSSGCAESWQRFGKCANIFCEIGANCVLKMGTLRDAPQAAATISCVGNWALCEKCPNSICQRAITFKY